MNWPSAGHDQDLYTDLIWFYVRTHGLRDPYPMQGPVYGIATARPRSIRASRPTFTMTTYSGRC